MTEYFRVLMSGYQGSPTLRLNVFKKLKIGQVVAITFEEEGGRIGHGLVGHLRVTSVCRRQWLQSGAEVLSVEGELIDSPLWQGVAVELRYYLRNKHMLMLRR